MHDPRQDVHKTRQHHPGLFRYKVAEKLLNEDGKGKTVLELGGGTGEFSRRLLARGFHVTYVDLNQNNIDLVERELGITGHCININEGLEKFEDEKFVGVVILDVIEHIVAAESLLKEINRVLKKGGFLILSTPNFSFFMNRVRIMLGKLTIDEGYHYRFFTKKVLKLRLEEAGFHIEKSCHFSPAIGVNIVWNKILRRKRLHLKIPDRLSALFSQTLAVRAVKK